MAIDTCVANFSGAVLQALALYADDTAVIATSRKPTLLVSYLES